MQLRYEQLSQLLNTKRLAPIYFISGDEPLLVKMSCDSIRDHAKKQGFSEREVFFVESCFNWQTLLTHANNYDLFAEKQILELHLAQGVSESAAQAFNTYALNPPPNKLLLVITGKLHRRLQQAAWFKCIDNIGVFITLWPMETAQLSRWITERLAQVGLTAEKEAIQCLISATEGNLLASAQEIEKLSLYFTSDAQRPIIGEAMLQALADSARFDPFKLTDAALQGKAKRCLRILHRLKEEGIEPLLVLWSLSRECRQLASLAFQLAQGHNLRKLFQTYAIWEKRQPLFQHVLQSRPLTAWYTLLQCSAQCDRIIKGVTSGDIWQSLQQLSLQLAGMKTL